VLSENGSIWISIDDNECHYLKVLCDEVFGRANFVANVVWQSKDTPGNNAVSIAQTHNHILVFKKSDSFRPTLLARNERQIANYSNPDNDPRGPWLAAPLTRAEHRDRDYYALRNPVGNEIFPPRGSSWRRPPDKMRWLEQDKRIWWGKNGDAQFPMEKKFLSEAKEGVTNQTWWPYDLAGSTRNASAEMKGLFEGAKAFETPKPERLLQRVIEISTQPDELVLDSFAGSGTTGAVAHKMGRRWIIVELGEHCFTHVIPRMKKVIDGSDQGGISNDVAWKGGGGFKFYRLAESLLVKDKDLSTRKRPVYVINPKYDAKMLVRAICKIENFRYLRDNHWHGISSEHHFLYVTTNLLSQRHLDTVSVQLGEEEALLVYCTRRASGLKVPDNIEVKKIPRDLLAKCTFE